MQKCTTKQRFAEVLAAHVTKYADDYDHDRATNYGVACRIGMTTIIKCETDLRIIYNIYYS